jgi:molybdopterin synthase sulfur carrier subunit
MAVLRLFAAAREAAGRTTDEIPATTVRDVLDEACRRYGERFTAVLGTSRVWVNGQPAEGATPVVAADVVAVLPPVSGGARRESRPVRARGPAVRGNLALVPDPEPESEPEPEPVPPATGPSASDDRPPLAVVHKSVRPHGRLGLAWAVVTVGVAVAGPTWLAAWLAVAAFLAGAQLSVVWRKRGERPVTLLAGAIAAGLPIASSFNVGAMTAVVVAGMAAAFVTRLRSPTRVPSRDVALTLALGVPVGLAAASPVLVRHTGIAATLLLLAFACVYDASAYLVGTGAASAWEGPAAGVAAFIPLTIFAAVVLVPPFPGYAPLVLGLAAAVLTPAGPVAGSALLGDRTAHAPALRRLDSLLLMGPLWAWCALVLLK